VRMDFYPGCQPAWIWKQLSRKQKPWLGGEK
jgi:hypothetical protein